MSDPRLTDTDPRMTDPRDYRRTNIDPVDPGTGASNALWGWVAAALFVAAVLLFVFASGSGDQSASNGINLPPTASAPKLPPSTTGSATTDSGPRTPAPAPAAPAPAPANR
ncbi:MAG TPA: hypothetical protein VH249_14050 [Xanthobacteraceae bacterium]|nr:hypothetical protein [Xanthobacteraceae bacterium]